MKKDYKIAVAGTGYVGLSIAILLSQHHQVTAVDIIPEKVDMINNRKPELAGFICTYCDAENIFVSLHCNTKHYIRSTTQDPAILTYFIMNTVHKDIDHIVVRPRIYVNIYE